MSVTAEEIHHHHTHHHQQHHLQQQSVTSQLPQQQQQQQTHLPSPKTPSIENNGESPRPANDALEQHCQLVEEELRHLRQSESRYKQQYAEAQKREKMLVRRLAAKEQEMQDYASQNAELKASQAPTLATLRSVLLDPAVNILFQKLKAELKTTKARLEDTQNELSAWKFTPDSNTGKRLMAKCRLLYQENEELGKMTSNGRLAKLEGDLALQKNFSEEVKKSQSELDDFLQELDEDVEGMQSTILFLQQELKLAKDTITALERENFTIKTGSTNYDLLLKQQQFKDSVDSTEIIGENYLINGNNRIAYETQMQTSTSVLHTTDTDMTNLNHLSNHINSSGSKSNSSADDGNTNINTNLNTTNNCSNNSERISTTNLNNCTKILASNVLVETRTLRSSGRNINSVVEELRTSKLNLTKQQIISNGNGDSVDGNSSLILGKSGSVSPPSNLNNGSELIVANASNTYSVGGGVHVLHKPHKRGYREACVIGNNEHAIDRNIKDDENIVSSSDDENTHSNLLNNNNTSTKKNCKESVDGTTTSDCISFGSVKKARRTSVLSLDLNEEDSRIDMKASDDHPLNLVTTGVTVSTSDPLSPSSNGII